MNLFLILPLLPLRKPPDESRGLDNSSGDACGDRLHYRNLP
ncbi:hypothetical protein [Nostoc sp. WHI]|nr:hypothetical protein [Nostoc sp. WHI]